tara:strand:- start:78156 stop:79100 length:945 start_codon:yes stop_codon:yes gene_type:complete
MSPASRHHLWADGLLLATAMMWGTNILVFKHAIVAIDPLVFNFFRLVPATLTLGLLWWGQRYRWPARPETTTSQPPWIRLCCFALLNGLIYQYVFARGLALTTASTAALILASMPMWTAILSMCFLSERLRTISWIGLTITFVGTSIVVISGNGQISFGMDRMTGNLLMLGSALVWAAGTVLSKSILDTITPLSLAFFSALVTLPAHAIIAWPRFWTDIGLLLEPTLLAATIYAGAFSSGIAFVTWHAGVRILGGSHAAVYQNLVTLIAVLGGWLLLSEPATSSQLLGGCLVIGGLIAMRRGRHPVKIAASAKP